MVNFSGRYGLVESNLHAYNEDNKQKMPTMGMSIGWKFILNISKNDEFSAQKTVCTCGDGV